MSKLQLATLGILVAATSAAAPVAKAASVYRDASVMAAGACQPFVPTTQVRFNASGITNAGTTPIYVVCSLIGAPSHSESTIDDGRAGYIGLVATNGTGSAQSITCSARPGRVVGGINLQLASTKSSAIDPGTGMLLSWYANQDFSKAGLASANFTCALNPGMTINYIEMTYAESI